MAAKQQMNRAQKREAEKRYRRRRKVYKLTWDDDHEFADLVVRARGVPLGDFLELMDAADQMDDVDTDDVETMEELPSGIVGAACKLFDGFAAALIGWNLDQPVLDDDGEETDVDEAVPATKEGILGQDFGFMFQVVQAWMGAIGDASGPLGATSNGGKPSEAPPLPMEPLSANPGS